MEGMRRGGRSEQFLGVKNKGKSSQKKSQKETTSESTRHKKARARSISERRHGGSQPQEEKALRLP